MPVHASNFTTPWAKSLVKVETNNVASELSSVPAEVTMVALNLAPSSAAAALTDSEGVSLFGTSAPFLVHLILLTVTVGGASTATEKIAVLPA